MLGSVSVLLFASVTEVAVQAFVNAIIGLMIFAVLILPVLIIPYIFIKLGSVAGKVQAAVNRNVQGKGMLGGAAKRAAGNSKYGQAWKQAKDIRSANRRQMGQDLLRKHGGRAGGTLLGGVTAEGRAMGNRRLEALHREHDAKETAFAKQDLVRRGHIGDTQLRDTALGTAGEGEYERRAAMELLAERGRVNPLRQVGQGVHTAEEREWFEQAVTANAGKVYGKAPDLNSGNPAPFTGNSAEDVAQFHKSTVQTALIHPSATDSHRQEMLVAYDQAMANPLLAAKIDQDTQSAWEDLRTTHNSKPGATPVIKPVVTTPPPSTGTPPPTPPSSTGSGGTPPPSGPSTGP